MMKKLLLLAVCAFTFGAKAQVFNPETKIVNGGQPHVNFDAARFQAPRLVEENFEITDNHAILGTYTSDRYVTDTEEGYGFPDSAFGWVVPAVFLTQDWYEDLMGKDIIAMRFALTQNTDSCGALIMDLAPSAGGNYSMKTIGYKADEGAKIGWNYIVFDEPVTIPADNGHALLFGYEYFQTHDLTPDYSAYAVTCYPISVLNLGSSRNSFYFYANIHDWDTDTDEAGWWQASEKGDLSVQAIVDLGGESGLESVAENAGMLYVKERYSADGRLLTAPEKGINILQLSDGSTMKVVVK